MKNMIIYFILVLPTFLMSQDCDPPTANFIANENEISAHLNNNGALFFDGNDGVFIVPKDNPKQISPIFVNGLWLMNYDPGANLKLAGAEYGASQGKHDYYPGPLSETGQTDEQNCTNWDKIWKVSRFDIMDHISDFEDNGIIDNPIDRIYSWPGLGNSFFEDYNGFSIDNQTTQLAPFFDSDGNGSYNPENGDYPMLPNILTIPEEITWAIFNDGGNLHGETMGQPLRAEIQQTTWSFACEDKEDLNNTLFTSFLVTNKGLELWDSTHIGFFTDFDLGCYQDDYIGCSPENNTYYSYNIDNFDGAVSTENCFFSTDKSYGENPPAQGITFLNQPLSYFSYSNPQFLAPSMTNQLTGTWADMMPFTEGGDGTNPDAEPTNWVFPDLPTDSDGWSMTTADIPNGDIRAVASSKIGKVEPGGMFQLDIAFIYQREPDANNLENVSFLLERTESIQNHYNTAFSSCCIQSQINGTKEASQHNFQIFPNPVSDNINIISNDFSLEKVSIFSLNGQLVLEKKLQNQKEVIIDLNDLESGFYTIQIHSEQQSFYHKIVKH